MNSIVSAASLASATAIPSVTMAGEATTFSPSLVARLERLERRFQAKVLEDRVRSGARDKAFFAATGVTLEEWRDLLTNDRARWKEIDAVWCKTEYDDGEPLDECGFSIAWNEIDDEIAALADEIMKHAPRSLADVALQARYVALTERAILDELHPAGIPAVLKNLCVLAGARWPLGCDDQAEAASELPAHLASPLGATADDKAAPSAAADPILAAIEAHRRSVRAFTEAVSTEYDIEEMLPRELTKSVVCVGERNIVETDDPRWIRATEERFKASEAMEAAALDILDSTPTSLAGAVAALQYMLDNMDQFHGEALGWPRSLVPDDVDPETAKGAEGRSPEYFLMSAVVEGLRRLSV